MYSVTTQNRLANSIYSVAEAEKHSELARQALANQNLFEPYTAYHRLDQQRTGSLKQSDLIEFLGDNNIQANQNEVAYLFKKFDLNRDGQISYSDFLKAVLPREDSRLRQIASLRESFYLQQNMLLPTEVEKSLSKLMHQEIQNYRNLSEDKQQLVKSLDHNSLEAFKSLDLFNQGFITMDSLSIFMRAQGFPLTNEQLHAFFKAVDLDQVGRVSYDQLVESVHLMEPLTYAAQASSQIRQSSAQIHQSSAQNLQSQMQDPLQDSHSYERHYVSTYPHVVYTTTTTSYPTTNFPYVSFADIRLRENSLDRINRSRLADIETESRIRQIDSQAKQSLERSRSFERLQQIEQEGQQRLSKINEQSRIRELNSIRDADLSRSREIQRQVDQDNRQRLLDSQNASLLINREAHYNALDQSRLRQLADERNLRESQIRLENSQIRDSQVRLANSQLRDSQVRLANSQLRDSQVRLANSQIRLERQNSIDRLRDMDNQRFFEDDFFRSGPVYSPARLYGTTLDYSPVKNLQTQVRDIQVPEATINYSKVSHDYESSVRRTVYY